MSRAQRNIGRYARKIRNWIGAEATDSKSNEALRGYELYPYLKTDGTFDYETYRRIQIEGNRRKLDQIWVLEENIEFLSAYLSRQLEDVKFGICHGTRRGREQEWFRKYLGCEMIGTEISDSAGEFPHTIQWDFHQTKPEWIDAVDFIYSNSLDHSYDPESCFNAWMSCVRPGGLCILEHSSKHDPSGVNELDPFGAHIAMMPYLITKWGQGRYGVRELLEAPVQDESVADLSFLVIQRY